MPVLIDAAAAGVCGAVSALALLASTRAAELFAMLQVCVCVHVCDRGRLRLCVRVRVRACVRGKCA